MTSSKQEMSCSKAMLIEARRPIALLLTILMGLADLSLGQSKPQGKDAVTESAMMLTYARQYSGTCLQQAIEFSDSGMKALKHFRSTDAKSRELAAAVNAELINNRAQWQQLQEQQRSVLPRAERAVKQSRLNDARVLLLNDAAGVKCEKDWMHIHSLLREKERGADLLIASGDRFLQRQEAKKARKEYEKALALNQQDETIRERIRTARELERRRKASGTGSAGKAIFWMLVLGGVAAGGAAAAHNSNNH